MELSSTLTNLHRLRKIVSPAARTTPLATVSILLYTSLGKQCIVFMCLFEQALGFLLRMLESADYNVVRGTVWLQL